jgi:DNA-directed RNA polymerase subunit alpha
MRNIQNKFFSCVESRIQPTGEMYARFHIGIFFRGQGITFANALRRTLLSEMPGLCLTHVRIEGVDHEFATIPGVHQTALEVLLNLKQIVFTFSEAPISLFSLPAREFKGGLHVSGPGRVQAKDIMLPHELACLDPEKEIATLNARGELKIDFIFVLSTPHARNFSSFHSKSGIGSEEIKDFEKGLRKKFFNVESIPRPVTQVNYMIHEVNGNPDAEYISLEIWTNGSFEPKDFLLCALKKLTQFFYDFAQFTTLSLSTAGDTHDMKVKTR